MKIIMAIDGAANFKRVHGVKVRPILLFIIIKILSYRKEWVNVQIF